MNLKSQIIFSISVGADGDCAFNIEIHSENIKVHVHFWGEGNSFAEFGQRLIDFPASTADTVDFQIGIIKPNSYRGYLMVRAYCFNPQGHTALEITTDNNEINPWHRYLKFSILSKAASLNRLGTMLTNWNTTSDSELIWQP